MDASVTGASIGPAQQAPIGSSDADAGPRPRVLHVITHLDMGGAENVAMQLIDSLRAQMDFGLFAVLQDAELSAVGHDMAARLDAWQVPCFFGVKGRFKSGGVLVAALAIRRAIRRFRPDVVHVHTEIPELTYAVACALFPAVRRVPLLRTVHNSELWIRWGGIGSWVTQRLRHGMAVAVSRNAAAADAAIATRTPRPAAEIVHNGVQRPPAAASRPADAPRRVLFAGRLVHQKGADLLPAILAAAHAATQRRDVTVTIAGTGALRDAVAHGLAATPLDGWTVEMVAPIGGLSRQLGTFDVVLLPSRFEGFALLPLEVLMAGVPLVTTDAPGLNEAIPADYPLLAPVDDVVALGARLAGAIDAPEACCAIATATGTVLAERFSPVAMAEAYAVRYRTLAEGREKRA